MAARRAGVAFAAIAIVACGVWLTTAAPAWPPADATSGDAAAATPPSAADAPAAPASAPMAPAGADAVPAARIPAEPAAAGLAVLVLGSDQAPVAGATITVQGDDAQLRFPPTGADGRTRAARFPSSDVSLRATTDGAAGAQAWNWRGVVRREVTIRLRPNRVAEVVVRDTAGQALPGVEVRLAPGNPAAAATSPVTTTEANGTARLLATGDTWLAGDVEFCAVASVGAGTFRSAASTWRADGPTPLAVTIDPPRDAPGTGLFVHFVGADGAPAAARGTLYWWNLVTNVGHLGPEIAVDGPTAQIAAATAGATIQLELREPDRITVKTTVVMPAVGGRHDVNVRRGARAPVVEVPLVDGNGAPVTTGEFLLFARLSTGHTAEAKATPDANGVLAFVLPAAQAGSLEVARPLRKDELQWPPLASVPRPYNTVIGTLPPPDPPLAVLAFDAPGAEAAVRLAPVVVTATRDLVTGRVVDEDGRAVAGVRIGLGGVEAPEPAPFAHFATRSADDGTFAIRGTGLPDEVLVFARAPYRCATPVRTRDGAAPLQLVLQFTGSIATKLHIDATLGEHARKRADQRAGVALVVDTASLTPDQLVWYRERAFGGRRELFGRWHLQAGIGHDGAVALDDLVPGSYELRAFLGANEVLRIPGIRVAAGETTALPPRAIAEGIEVTQVRVLRTDGTPLRDARVRFKLAEWKETDPGGTNTATDERGEAWFVVPRNTITDVEVVAKDMAPHHERAARFPLEVRLGAGTTFDVALTGHEALRDDVRALTISCGRHDGDAPDTPVRTIGKLRQLTHPLATVAADGSCSIPNLPTGTWRVWLAAHPPLADRSGRGITFVRLGDFEVTGSSPAHLVIPHTLSASDLATLRGQ
jgi:hypothetical protein